MTDREFFAELVKRRLLEEGTAARVLEEISSSGTRGEDVLYERKLVDETAAAQVKSELIGTPFKRVDPKSVNESLLSLIPNETAETYKIVPLERTPTLIIVGMVHPDDARAQEALRFIAKREGVSIGAYLITPSDFAAIMRQSVPYTSEVAAAVREVKRVAGNDDVVNLDEAAKGEEGPIIKIVSSTLKQAVEVGASDIHVEPQREHLRIRVRINGELEEITSLPLSLVQPVVSRIKVLARLKLDETRVPQDGRFRTVMFGRDIDYRVATFPTPNGEKVAIRVLDPETGLKSFKDLGLNPYNARVLEAGVRRPYGMVLVSGPTGSGKTTTLYAIMNRLNTPTVNIVSLEDPVEYFIQGMNQSQVKPEIGYDFASGLRQILRQDPDVIMVGEIRDAETANLAVNAALTGHVLLSTIHTNNAIGVVPRLVDLGAQPFLLSSALNLMVAQRLVLKLCPTCKKQREATGEVRTAIEQSLARLTKDVRGDVSTQPPFMVSYADPKPTCTTCKGKGVAGRIALFEIFSMTRELGDLIAGGFTEGKLFEEAKRQGMVTLRDDGILKALSGITSMEEILRETAE